MFKLKKFNINDDELRERKLKFIEIILLVGGIIGGVRLQNKNDLMNIIFVLFLISSVLYYFLVSNKIDVKISFEIAIILIALGFSVIAIGPLIYVGMQPTYTIALIFLSIVLGFFVFIALYQGKKK